MPLSDQDRLLIEKYLQGPLTDSEQALFLERMKDEVFKAEYLLHQCIQKSSIAIKRSQLKDTFHAWDQETGKSRTTLKSLWSDWKVAAAVLLLIGAGILWMFIQKESPDQLFNTYYQPYANLIDPIDKGDAPVEASLTQLYELGRYEDVDGRHGSRSLIRPKPLPLIPEESDNSPGSRSNQRVIGCYSKARQLP